MPLLTHRCRRTARLGLALGLAACGGRLYKALGGPWSELGAARE